MLRPGLSISSRWLPVSLMATMGCGSGDLYPVRRTDLPASSDKTGWCASQSSFTLCADFDDPGEPGLEAVSSSHSGFGKIDASASVSPPNALALTASDSVEDHPAYAFWGAHDLNAGSFVELEYDLRLESLPADVISHQLRFGGGATEYQVQLFLQDGAAFATDGLTSPDVEGSFIALATAPTVGRFVHVLQSVRFQPAPLMSVELDGLRVLADTPLKAGWLSGELVIQLGISYVTPAHSATLSIDNVLVRAE